MEEIDRINLHRGKYQDKIRTQLDELMFISVEGDKPKHKDQLEDLQTNLIILWRFDRKLQQARNEESETNQS